jgi:hypothetical protein
MNGKRMALVIVPLAILALCAGSVLGHAAPLDTVPMSKGEASSHGVSAAPSTTSDNVVVRFCPPVKAVSSCYDCPTTFQVDVCVTSVSNLHAFEWAFCFDDALKVGDIESAGLAQGWPITCTQSSRCVTCSAQKPDPCGVDGQGSLATVQLTREAGGGLPTFPTHLHWESVELKKCGGEEIPASTEDGCVASDCLKGDVWKSCDCHVDVADVLWVIADWLWPFSSICPRCDCDTDGDVDWDDVKCIAGQFGTRCQECSPTSQAHRLSEQATVHKGVGTASGTAVGIESSSLLACVGETFSIDVTVRGADKVMGFEFVLAFDPDVLQVEGVEPGDFLPKCFGYDPLPLGPLIDNSQGSVRYGGVGPCPASDDGTLARVRFRARGLGNSSLSLSEVNLCAADILPRPDLECRAADEVTGGSVTVHECLYLPIVFRYYQ